MEAKYLILVNLIGAAVYYYYLWTANKSYGREDERVPYPRKYVSVVIAARNESNNIAELLVRLKNQNYPAELYEIILADDGSTDDTFDQAMRFAANWENLRVIRVKDREQAISKKKNALQQVIPLAKGEIILLTDADCLPGRGWISSMVGGFNENTDMVVGLSRTKDKNISRVFSAEWFEHFDFMAMYGVAGGLIIAGKYFSCSGQNLAYKKASWEKVGGFSRIMHIISGDDVNLMQLFRQAGMNIRFNQSPGSFTSTAVIDNWFSLINQRTRWASNTRYQLQLNPEFFVYLMSALVVTFLPWALLAYQWKLGISLLVLRVFLEMSFLQKVFKKFKEPDGLIKTYPVWFILQPAYMLIVGVSGLFGWFKWKK